MNNLLRDLAANLLTIDDYTRMVVFCTVVTALWLVRTMTESTALTVLFSPAILFGALAANYLFRINFVVASGDKDTDVVVASAIGVLLALILMLLASRIAIAMGERRSRARPQKPLLPSVQDLASGRK